MFVPAQCRIFEKAHRRALKAAALVLSLIGGLLSLLWFNRLP
jgi:UDP-N-acetylmuramyl pentapeptide phosphotransferase/UDP-N-acetylglucosamine-1-phosphate transferase